MFIKEYTTEADSKNKTHIMISKNILIECAFPLHLNKCATHMINAKKTKEVLAFHSSGTSLSSMCFSSCYKPTFEIFTGLGLRWSFTLPRTPETKHFSLQLTDSSFKPHTVWAERC